MDHRPPSASPGGLAAGEALKRSREAVWEDRLPGIHRGYLGGSAMITTFPTW
jgi:hypothetical protein